MSSTTPMMKQYLSVKEKYRDAILLFHLGDFYEMFFDDAKKASKLLDLTLTSRNKNAEDSVPLCGIPVHSAQGYINRLLSLGHKVAICDQVEDPKQARGIVKREVVKVLTPGLVLDPECLEGKSHNYLISVARIDDRWGLATADISTGSFKLTEIYDEKKLLDEVCRLEPKEILLDEKSRGKEWQDSIARALPEIRINFMPGWHFDKEFGKDLYYRTYRVHLDGLGLSELPAASTAGGALLSYLDETKFLKEKLLSRPAIYHFYGSMALDENTKRNLELAKTIASGSRNGSLIWLIDRAQTSMGSRMLKDWLLYPLISIEEIRERQKGVEEFFKEPALLDSIRRFLAPVSDLERIQSRVLAGQAHARELVALRDSLRLIPKLKDKLSVCQSSLLKAVFEELDPLADVCNEIQNTLVDDPPLALKEGGIIRDGFDQAVDELRQIQKSGRSTIAALEAKEREKTGISSLKIRYNRVFGYYIEVTHTHKDKIPSDYVRKQTLTSAERFITSELKEYEDKVLGASEKIRDLEYELFVQLREKVASQSDRIKKTAVLIATLDAVLSLAFVAVENRYVCPEVVEDPVIEICKGRHPLVERTCHEEPFVPNDTILNQTDCRLMIITGPNMAGKSTVMRQTALITLMAQMGSFVPAEKARIGIVDRICTRIGASDHLQKGHSTFMVEMLETAHILSHATDKSLILLDEIGRGTSTFDGMSIAWAVAETIHDRIKARTLFATHYHELTDLADEKEGICNFHMAIVEWKGEVKFIRELKRGGTNRSYGVFVASMAGLPPETIKRAKEILRLMEEKDLIFRAETIPEKAQPSLFETQNLSVIEDLKKISLDETTPLEALNLLAKLKRNLV